MKKHGEIKLKMYSKALLHSCFKFFCIAIELSLYYSMDLILPEPVNNNAGMLIFCHEY